MAVENFYPIIKGSLLVTPGPIVSATASVDANVGTPEVEVNLTGTQLGQELEFIFRNLKGQTGTGIQSIEKTGTSGLVDTYTITFTDGTSTTFQVTNGAKGDTGAAAGFGTPTATIDGNVGTPSVTISASGPNTAKIFAFAFHNLKGATGNGIQSIYKTGTSGLVDTYTILFTDGTTTEFEVTNGQDGTVTPEQLYAAYVTDSASGSIASFPDGADDIPVKSLIAQITPLQDLHGQANPYPAGGGKNKLPMTVEGIKGVNLSGTWNGNVFTSTVGTVVTIVTDSDNNVTGIALSGTSTGVLVFDLTPLNGFEFPAGSYILTGGLSSGIRIYDTNTISDQGSGASFTLESATTKRFAIRIASGLSLTQTLYPMIRLSTESDATFAPYSNICPISGWTGANIHVADDENPHVIDNVYPIDWTDEAGTLFKGNINVTTGLLTVTALELTMSKDDAWGYSSSTLTFYKNLSGDFVRKNYDQAFTGLCDTFPPYDGVSAISSGNFVMFYTTNAQGVRFSMPSANGDLPTFKEAIDGVKVIYPIVTPITYQLSPTEVKTLLGDNNIWADCGDVDVTYRADTALYIDKKLGA